ncbi:MAG TPA: efflux RND transporter periplasmic adaptor subunit [Longimicrobiales bacterium]
MTVGIGRVAGAAVAAVVLATVTGCGASGAAEAEAESAPELVTVERRDLDISAEAAGIIEPVRVVEVKSKASGEILDLTVDTGDRVEEGALLATIDPRDVRNALDQAEADLEVARARLATAEAQRKRSAELHEANVITEQEFESAALEEATARAQFIKAQTNLELARERMGDVTIKAPMDGTIIQRDVEVGQIIASASQNISGGTILMLMADLSDMQVRVLVDETDIGRIQPGQSAGVTVQAYPGRVFRGEVIKIEPQAVVDQNVTMFPVLVGLENREGLLKPGMNAEVEIEIARRQDVVVVPNAAVVALPDVVDAGAVLGLEPEAVQAAMRGRRPGGDMVAMAGRENAQSAGTDGHATDSGASAASPQSEAAEAPGDACASLRAKIRDGGIGSLTEEERGRMRECGRRFGRGRPGGPFGGQGGRGSDARPAVVFVQGPDGPEPRRIMLGLNDWEYAEVLRGLEPGEKIYLISVARLQQEQQERLNRFRERASAFPGSR